jgi:hypothetical protein
MENDETLNPMRLAIESVSNFLKKQKQTETKQLDDNSKDQDLGDPLTDVKMNEQADSLGSDGKNAPTVSVTAGTAKGGNGPETGQPKAQFHDKTSLAENNELTSDKQIRAYVVKVLQEQMDAKIKEEQEVSEGVSNELLDEPTPPTGEMDEGGRSHALGRVSNLKPKNYPKSFKR